MELKHHAAPGGAAPSPGTGRSPERAALRGRDAEHQRCGSGGVHANGAEVCIPQVVPWFCLHTCLQVATCDRATARGPACAGGPALQPSMACLSCTGETNCLQCLIGCTQYQAPVPLPGSPELPAAPPQGTEWMERELKADAGPHSPTSIYAVEDARPRVRAPRTGPLCMLSALLPAGMPATADTCAVTTRALCLHCWSIIVNCRPVTYDTVLQCWFQGSNGARVLVQGKAKKGKVKRGKLVLPVDFTFKHRPSEEEEPGSINHHSAQASPCSSMIGFSEL